MVKDIGASRDRMSSFQQDKTILGAVSQLKATAK